MAPMGIRGKRTIQIEMNPKKRKEKKKRLIISQFKKMLQLVMN